MAITKILNIMGSEGRNPASHLKNALEYIQNPDKTEECVLVGSINCLPDTAFEQMEETKNIFHKTGKRQGWNGYICVLFDIPFEETVRRHNTRDKKQEFGEEDMRRWWREKDFSSVFNEKIITSDIDADSIVEMIYIAINEQI